MKLMAMNGDYGATSIPIILRIDVPALQVLILVSINTDGREGEGKT
jgi:hypothetical protein